MTDEQDKALRELTRLTEEYGGYDEDYTREQLLELAKILRRERDSIRETATQQLELLSQVMSLDFKLKGDIKYKHMATAFQIAADLVRNISPPQGSDT